MADPDFLSVTMLNFSCVSVLYEDHKATLNDELTQLPSKASYLYKVNIIVKDCARVRRNSSRPGFQEKRS